MNHVEALTCNRCGRAFAPDDVTDTCPAHDGVAGLLDVVYDDDALARRFDPPASVTDVWSFRELLPVEDGPVAALGAGGTPLLDAPTLSDALDARLRVKDETGNPTGSNKDRGTAVVAARALHGEHDVVTCASTGNAAASLAGYAARAGLDCRIFVPADVPDAKAVQPRLYGADVLTVDGSYEDAYDLCRRVARERGWYNGSAGVNPYAVEGKRTLGFELALQAPDADWVVMSMGNGCSLAAAWKGVAEFERLGYTDGTPRLLGVQAAGATAIYDQFTERSSDGSSAGGTTADSIDVTAPHNAERACAALDASGGDAIVVDDEAILRAQRTLGETEGLFVEPASAATVAGVERARERGTIGPEEDVVLVATGTGLKDTTSAERAVEDVEHVVSTTGDVPEF